MNDLTNKCTKELLDVSPTLQQSVDQICQLRSACYQSLCLNSGIEHWKGVKRVLRYVRGTLDNGLIYSANDTNTLLTGYSDADWAGDLSKRRSTTGYVFQIQGSTVSWCSKRQACVARSTTEAEYIALSTTSQEAVWLRRLLQNV